MNKFKILKPATFLVCAGTGCGKTMFVLKMIKHRLELFDNQISKIVFCYEVFQEEFNKYPEIIFHKGLISDPEKMFPNTGAHYILVLDDMLTELVHHGELISKLFTVYSHHLNINVFLLSQNLFFQSKYMRNITLNAHYIIIFGAKRDKSQIKKLMVQIYPSKSNILMEIYNKATKGRYTYLCIDLSPCNDEQFILRENIFPHEIEHIHIPANTD